MRRFNRTIIKGLKKDESGSIAPLFGLLSMPMFFVIGMSVDYSRTIGVENQVQNALDAAALAAMIADTTDVEIIGTNFFNANFNAANAQNPIVHFTKLDDGSVRATASVSVPTLVSNIIGVNTLQVETFSVVEPPHEVATTTSTEVANSVIPCLHVMDQSGSYALDMSGNKDLDADQCTVYVRSNSSQSVRSQNSTNVKWRKIRTKGGGSLDSGSQTTSLTGTVEANAAIVGNPYESAIRDVVQAISIGNCTNANTGTSSNPKVWTGAVNPGTYCGATTFSNATFATGLYIIKSGSGSGKDGALKITGNTNGSAGVTFFLADNKTKLTEYSATSGSTLKAPTTGTTRGLLIFEDSNRGSNWSLTMSSLQDQNWEGVVYLPSANLTMTLKEWDQFKVSMAVNQLKLTSWDLIEWLPYSWTPFNTSTPITFSDDTETTTTTTTSATDIYLKE
jgi:hypothetical protein